MRYTVVLEVPLDAIQFEKDEDRAFERAHFAFMGLLRSVLGRGRGEVQPGRAALAAPQPPRRAEARATRSSCARSRCPRGATVSRRRRWTGRRGRRRSSSTASASRRNGAGRRAEQPRRGQADRAGRRGALASDDPFRVGDARIVPWVDRAGADPGSDALGLFFVAYVPPGSPAPQVTLEFERDGHVVGRAEPALPAPDAHGRVPYVVSVPAGRFAPGRYEVRAELAAACERAWERCSFRIASPPVAARRPTRSAVVLNRTPLIPARAGRYPRRTDDASTSPPSLSVRAPLVGLALAAAARPTRSGKPDAAPRPRWRSQPRRPGPRQAELPDAGRARHRRRRRRRPEGPGGPRAHAGRLRRHGERDAADDHELRGGRRAARAAPRRGSSSPRAASRPTSRSTTSGAGPSSSSSTTSTSRPCRPSRAQGDRRRLPRDRGGDGDIVRLARDRRRARGGRRACPRAVPVADRRS